MSYQKYCVDCGDRCGTSCGKCSLPVCIFCEMHECGLSHSTGAMGYVQNMCAQKDTEIRDLRKQLEQMRARLAACTCTAAPNVEKVKE